MPDPTVSAPRARYGVLAWFCLAALISYVQRTSIGVATGDLQATRSISDLEMGTVMSAYFWGYAVGQIPGGRLCQRFGARIMLPASMAASSLFVGGMAFCDSAEQLALVWMAAGLGIGALFPGCVQSIVHWFPASERAFPSGSLGSSMSVGGALSTALTGWLLIAGAGWLSEAWRLTFLLYAMPGLLWAVAFPWTFRDRPPASEAFEVSGSDGSDSAASEGPDWRRDYRTILICLQQFLRAAGYIFYATWFPTFLRETRGVSMQQAGLLTSLPLLGVVAGGAFGGFLIDQIDQQTRNRRISRQLVAVVCHALCGLIVLVAARIESPRTATLVIAAGSFLFAIGGACSYTITMDLGGPRAATLFAVMNTCGNVGAAICPAVVGYLVTRLGWQPILGFFGTLYLGVAGCWVLLDPTPGRRSMRERPALSEQRSEPEPT
ncbi:MAG: MFS transporter [Planctomyces sp.]|nr:MFS transporter [Planctomyces sp.]